MTTLIATGMTTLEKLKECCEDGSKRSENVSKNVREERKQKRVAPIPQRTYVCTTRKEKWVGSQSVLGKSSTQHPRRASRRGGAAGAQLCKVLPQCMDLERQTALLTLARSHAKGCIAPRQRYALYRPRHHEAHCSFVHAEAKPICLKTRYSQYFKL